MTKNFQSKKPSLLISAKRPLLRPRTVTTTKTTDKQETHLTTIHNSLNPSSVPAGIQIRRPVFLAIPQDQNGDVTGNISTVQQQQERENKQHQQVNQDENRNTNAEVVIELDFSCPPQPFLDVDVWERWNGRRIQIEMDKHRKRGGGVVEGQGSGQGSRQGHTDATHEETETSDHANKRQRETEYGSMAVKKRKSVRSYRRRG